MLYHFSEEGNIPQFVPRAPLAHPNAEPRVWTIDDVHAPLYFFPRDCPRVAFWPLQTTTEQDRVRFYTGVSARMVIAIEYDWLPRVQSTCLYRYEMPDATFVSLNDHGAHVSHATVAPQHIERMDDLLSHLQRANVELRLLPRLAPLFRTLITSTLHFSGIRLRNAQDWHELQNL